MSKTVLCVLLKVLMLARADIFSKYQDLNIIQNLKSDRSHPDSVSLKNKIDEISFTNMSVIPESIDSTLSKLTSPRAFVEFYNGFPNEKDDISMTIRWNQPEFTDEIIQGYTVQCWFIENLKEMHICDDKSISATILECTVHNLKPNTTYYIQVQAHTKIGVSPYTDLIDVSTMHENPIPQLLMVTRNSIDIWDLDSKINVNIVKDDFIVGAAYSMAEHKIYWSNLEEKLMMLDFKENNITEIVQLEDVAMSLCIDWVARNLYWIEISEFIMKLDLTLWQNGIVKFDEILKMEGYYNIDLTLLPSIETLYWINYSTDNKYQIIQSDLDGKKARIFHNNSFITCPFLLHASGYLVDMKIDDMNTKEQLVYWLWSDILFVTDINVSMCNLVLQTNNINEHEIKFKTLTIDKTNIYISSKKNIYVLRKQYALLDSVDAFKYIKKIRASSRIFKLYAFGKSLQPYPPTRCLTPDKKVYNIRILTVTMSSIIVYLPEIVPKSECKNNLPTTLYTINISYCLDNELNKFDNFTVQTTERYYEIQNLTSYTEYKLLLVISNFYSEQLSMDPLFGSEMIVMMRSKPSKLDAPENVTVEALTPTVAAVYWMPPKTLNMPVIHEVHLVCDNNLLENRTFIIEKAEHMRNGIFFKIIEELTPGQNYTIYERIYPVNFSDYYNDSLSKILYMYSEPNNIILSDVSITNMIISWIPSVNLTIPYKLEYKNVEMQKWQIAHNFELKKKKKVMYYIEKLRPKTRYEFRLILRYPKYEKDFIWPSDGRFTFSTLTILDSTLSKPTSPRAFVEFYNGIPNEKDDISVTFRWHQPNITDKLIQGYTVQGWFIENQKEIQICNKICKSISAAILERAVHNLKPNTTYYFTVQTLTKVGTSSYTDLINVSTTHENPIPQLLMISGNGIAIWDLDSNIINNLIEDRHMTSVAYSIAEDKIYWSNEERKLMMLKINENNIIQIAELQNIAHNLCIDWVARNLYWIENGYISDFIMKLDLTMWQNGIVKYDKIWEMRTYFSSGYLNILPSKRTLYWTVWTKNFKQQQIIQSDLDGKNARIFQHNNFSMCHFSLNTSILLDMKIDDVNTKKPLIYWLWKDFLIVTDINVSMCNLILQIRKNEVYRKKFDSLTIGKTYIYISLFDDADIYVLEKKYALLESVNAFKYIKKVRAFSQIHELHAFGKSLQSYPPTRCLTPDKKVLNNTRILTVTTSSIIVYLPEIVPKSGCTKYNLPTTLYTINITNYCLDDELNKFDNFTVQTTERYYEIQNLTYTKYKLLPVIRNFYSDQLSMDPLFGSEMIVMMRSKPSKLDAPENVTVGALTPNLAVVYWMPPKKLNMPVIYQIRIFDTNSMGEINRIVMEKTIGKPTYMGDGKFLEEIEDRFDPRLFNPGQKYMICVRIHPVNFSNHYNDSLNKTLYMYSEPNDIIRKEADITSMIISWIPPVNLTINYELEYKNIEMKWQKWQIANNFKLNNGEEINYYIEELQPGTLYEFRLILRYPRYEKDFIWPSDGRFTFSTLTSDISSLGNIRHAPLESTHGTLVLQYFLPILSFVAIVTLICVYYFYCYRQRNENNEQVLPPIMTDIELAILHEIPNGNIQFNTLYNPILEYNSDKYVLTEIKREEVRLEKLLGSGAFGMVYQAKVINLEGPGTEIPAAIKMLSINASSEEKQKFLEEARVMNYFQHKHVLRLLAVCLDKDSPLIVLELMEIDLLQYLRDSRKLQPSDLHALRLQDLFAICEDVARGCCYLENMRFVHRDLACRNCLVSARDRENRVVKIGDFGLARHISKNDYYRKIGQGLLPICWMAPESLVVGIFTSQSDVWSFGILMWEITSLGEHPYTGRTNLEVIDYVRAGGRLSIPLNCPPTLYELMLRCWNPANDRPNFKLCLETIIALRNNIEDTLLNPVDII